MSETRPGRGLRAAVIALAGLLAAIVLPLYAIKVARKTDYTDFEVYYRAAHRVSLGLWEQVYTMADGASPFRYAPWWLPFFRPFAWLSLPQARQAWYFIQYAWFALGFYCLERALRLTRAGRGRGPSGNERARKTPGLSLFITAVAMLYVLRFCLDCFTIGQVSSLLFLGYSAALWAWMARRPAAAGSALLLPSAFKIGPGILYSLFAAAHKSRERVRAIGAPLLWLAAATVFTRLWCGSSERFLMLWRTWADIVANDSVYYDASHYGSQSIKSAILRAVKSGWLSAPSGAHLYLAAVLCGCGLILAFWLSRRPRTPLGRGAFVALGIFPYLWFMPETFKYSLTALAIPVALLLAQPRKSLLTWVALGFGALTLSLAGLDITGPRIFFALQRASVPLGATLLLGAATLRLAILQSRPLWPEAELASAPWPVAPPPASEPVELSLLIPLPLRGDSRLGAAWTRRLVLEARSELAASQLPFEILLIPFGNRASRFHPAWLEAESLAASDPRVRLLPAASAPMPGAALRDGFLASRGRLILSGSAEQPCEPEFFTRAVAVLRDGSAELVRANRRLPETRFRIPVRELRLVYGRHRLSLRFNALVRACLPVGTTDTHSGTWAMSRRCAISIFALQRAQGFLFELEAWTIAASHGIRTRDLPVRLLMAHEKTARRVGYEILSCARGIPSLYLRYRQGYYDPRPIAPQGITADDWGISPGVNQGILELARLGIVRRVSLMAYGGYLGEGLEELRKIPGVSLGLHFDLTYGKQRPGGILRAWVAARFRGGRQALGESARAELRKQLGILGAAGVTARHLDGHHHIHLVPGMLDALAPVIREAAITQVRLPDDPALLWRKPLLWLLTRQARGAFRRGGFKRVACFYPQAVHFGDQGWLRARLRHDPEAEVIVHPASIDNLARLRIPDSYTSGRVTEFRALRMLTYANGPQAPAAPPRDFLRQPGAS